MTLRLDFNTINRLVHNTQNKIIQLFLHNFIFYINKK